jgi:two-component system, chemotaxis family, chemotaxis protein CheY
MSSKVIIIDDAAFMREIFLHILTSVGYEVVAEAASAKQAEELLSKHEADILILDLVMPEKNGVVFAKEILQKYPHLKILATSSATDNFVINSAYEAGCHAFLAKPFTKDSLLKGIREATQIRKEVSNG